MELYSDEIVTPSELKRSYLKRLYGRINRGLSDSYEKGYALLSNFHVVTPDGWTLLGGFNEHELPLVKDWLTECGYTLTPYTLGTWLDSPHASAVEIYKVTWPEPRL